jgi:hypothetical protein
MPDNMYIEEAKRQGRSDGYYSYPSDPADFKDDARRAYLEAYTTAKVFGFKAFSRGEPINGQ